MALSTNEFTSQFGEKLLNPSDKYSPSAPSDALASKDYILLYFSAKWCGPCRGFTPKLIEVYNKLKSSGKNLELVFCSLDREKKEWEDYTSSMPWLCMPFDAAESKKMARTYKADGIPHLVIVDGSNGEIINTDGTSEIQSDPEGAKFPWKPKTFGELIPKQIFAASKPKPDSPSSEMEMLDTSTLKDKYLMLYFSAHWCPPCKAFTPVLSEAYTKLKAERDDFELVFVSSDRNEESFQEYFDEMAFCALPFEYRDEKSALSKKFGVRGIPCLIMLGPVSNEETMERPLINKNIRSFIESGDFSEFPFEEKNYGDVNNADDLNEVKSLVVFHEGGDDDEQDEIKSILKEVGDQMKMKMKGSKDGGDKCNFLWALSTDGLAPRIRSLLSMPKIPGEEPTMVILDLPDEGGYYKNETQTSITADSIMEFIQSPGERMQLK